MPTFNISGIAYNIVSPVLVRDNTDIELYYEDTLIATDQTSSGVFSFSNITANTGTYEIKFGGTKYTGEGITREQVSAVVAKQYPASNAAISTSDSAAWEKMLTIDGVTVGNVSSGMWGATGSSVTIPQNATIDGVELVGYCKGATNYDSIVFIISNIDPSDSLIYSYGVPAPHTEYNTVTHTWATNPQTDLAWDIDNAINSTFGITRPTGAGQTVYLDSMYKNINYTVPIQDLTGLELISSSAKIDISGTAYTDNTKQTTATDGTKINLIINNTFKETVLTTNGEFLFPNYDVSVNDVINICFEVGVLFGDTEEIVVDANTDISGIELIASDHGIIDISGTGYLVTLDTTTVPDATTIQLFINDEYITNTLTSSGNYLFADVEAVIGDVVKVSFDGISYEGLTDHTIAQYESIADLNLATLSPSAAGMWSFEVLGTSLLYPTGTPRIKKVMTYDSDLSYRTVPSSGVAGSYYYYDYSSNLLVLPNTYSENDTAVVSYIADNTCAYSVINPASVTTWATATDYVYGQLVRPSQSTKYAYKCIQNHTSSENITTANSSYWKSLDTNNTIDVYTSDNTDYDANTHTGLFYSFPIKSTTDYRSLSDINLNPAITGISEGFIFISDEENTPARANITTYPDNNSIYYVGDGPYIFSTVSIIAQVVDAKDNYVSGETVTWSYKIDSGAITPIGSDSGDHQLEFTTITNIGGFVSLSVGDHFLNEKGLTPGHTITFYLYHGATKLAEIGPLAPIEINPNTAGSYIHTVVTKTENLYTISSWVETSVDGAWKRKTTGGSINFFKVDKNGITTQITDKNNNTSADLSVTFPYIATIEEIDLTGSTLVYAKYGDIRSNTVKL